MQNVLTLAPLQQPDKQPDEVELPLVRAARQRDVAARLALEGQPEPAPANGPHLQRDFAQTLTRDAFRQRHNQARRR